MAKKKTIFTVDEDLSVLFTEKLDRTKAKNERNADRLTDRFIIDNALSIVTRQMEISGKRPRFTNGSQVWTSLTKLSLLD